MAIPRRRSSRRYVRATLLAVGSALLLLNALIPFYFVLSVSVTPEQGLFAREVRLIPDRLTLENYRTLLDTLKFGTFFRNSTIVAVSTTALTLALAVPASYAFARFRFKGRRPMITGMLLMYMIPPVVMIVPLLVIFRRLHLVDTFPGIILADATMTIPFATWLLLGYFASLPKELEDAALVDGCTPVGALARIVLPLAIPGIVAAGLFVFISSWNEFLFAFMLLSRNAVKTVPPLLRAFVRGESGVFWGTIMASATLTTLPVALLFLFFQRYLIRGLSAGAVKG